MFFLSEEAPKVAADLVYQRLSAAAYQPEAVARHKANELGYKFIKHVRDRYTGADAIVVRNKCEVVVAFRGTEKNYADIMTDLKFKKQTTMFDTGGFNVPVHRGFLEQWRSIEEDLKIAIAEASETIGLIPVKVTGHSLGGALAILATIDWPWVHDCITFGAPRVGDREITYAVRRNEVLHRRYVFGADIVPAIPLLAMAYRHDCPSIYLTRVGEPIRNCPIWREALGRARALLSLKWCKGWSIWPVPARMFTDHRISEYGSAMAECNS